MIGDLGILWVGPVTRSGSGPRELREQLYAYRCQCEGTPHGQHVGMLVEGHVGTMAKPDRFLGFWLPRDVKAERPNVWASAGRFWVERTRVDGISMRWGLVPVQLAADVPRAHVTVTYSVTVKTGETEGVAGGVPFMKAQVGVTMPCAPDEVKDVEADLAEWLGGVLAGERDEIIAEFGLEPVVSLEAPTRVGGEAA